MLALRFILWFSTLAPFNVLLNQLSGLIRLANYSQTPMFILTNRYKNILNFAIEQIDGPCPPLHLPKLNVILLPSHSCLSHSIESVLG